MVVLNKITGRFLAVLKPAPKAILILAHMRSGSSLLEHIFSSHPEIVGAGEQSRNYHSKLDFKKAGLFITRINKQQHPFYNYITDQVLHNHFTPNIKLFSNNKVKVVFLIRNPEETLASIEHLGGPYGIFETNKYSSSVYYTTRLKYLVSLSKQIPEKNQFFLTYEDLVTDPDNVLKTISVFLDLKTPLTKEYRTKESTGKFGDTSKNIKKGTIVKTQKKQIIIDPQVKEELNTNFSQAYSSLKK